MSIDPKTSQQFYVTTGSGDDKIDSNKKTDLETLFTADKSKGNTHVINDPTLGPLVLNMQRMQDDEDNTRTFIQNEDEVLNVIKGTFPSGCIYHPGNSKWIIPWTRTEWMGGFVDHKGGGAYWGFNKNTYGAKDLIGNLMWVEKVIPIGFQVYRVYVFGSNAGGAGNESQFRSYASTLISNTNTGAGDSSNAKKKVNTEHQSMDSTVISSGALNGDGLKTIRVEAGFGDKNDVLYGGIIELTQI
tara:strand:- start:2743 stop:3474 length:732 start_codon:yes stop_codon:yes gene_type:complete